MPPTSIIVVGNGLFGAAATRHLAERGHDVLSIGAAAVYSDVRGPGIASEVPPYQVYSSHNDAARLTRLQDRDAIWAAVTRGAVRNYRQLEAASGIPFFHDVGCLISSRAGGDGINADPLAVMGETNVAYELFEPGDDRWQERWPELAFPDTHYVAFEPSPAGYIKPKPLIAAQNRLAKRADATFTTGIVTGVNPVGNGIRVTTAEGAAFDAGQVLVAAGGFTNFNGLLEQPVDITLKSEVIALARVDEQQAEELSTYPTVKYLVDPGDLESIYMTPPVRYEDGNFYIKLGANTRLDRWLTTLEEVQQWFGTDTETDYREMYRQAITALWPSIDVLSIQTQPCIITYSGTRMPIIEQVSDGLFVATAGNGGGAKGSDSWGERAARVIEEAIRLRPSG